MYSTSVRLTLFFLNDPPPPEISPLPLPAALPISPEARRVHRDGERAAPPPREAVFDQAPAELDQQSAFCCSSIHASASWFTAFASRLAASIDRKSTRLNSSHSQISYAVFCLKKKK